MLGPQNEIGDHNGMLLSSKKTLFFFFFFKSQWSPFLFCLCPNFFTEKTPFSLSSQKLSLVTSQNSRRMLPFWVPRVLQYFLLMGEKTKCSPAPPGFDIRTPVKAVLYKIENVFVKCYLFLDPFMSVL